MAPFRLVSALSLTVILSPLPAWAQLQTTISPALPSLNTDDAKPTASDDGTYCRPPMHRTDSRLPGPKVCMTIKKWNDLHAAGLDIAPDGFSTVPLERNTQLLSH
jgi:hypothetical protein